MDASGRRASIARSRPSSSRCTRISERPTSARVVATSPAWSPPSSRSTRAAGAEPARGCFGGPHEHRRSSPSAVERATGLVGEHVARQEMELLGRHVGDHGRHDVDAPAQRRRQRLVEIAHERTDAVPARTRDGHRIDVGGDHGSSRTRRAEDGGHRPAAGAQVDGDPDRPAAARPPAEPAPRVCGLGTNTPGSTRTRTPQKRTDPMIQASGSPRSRRAISSSMGPTPSLDALSSASASSSGATQPPSASAWRTRIRSTFVGSSIPHEEIRSSAHRNKRHVQAESMPPTLRPGASAPESRPVSSAGCSG